ncbi:hypothetical protein LTS18_005066 [Coniosporium uncinatum]|uniref:Uncharacterized protein n=1 Tax=Coniosporium uncinatum TaxID=93489 RepID=A0ACC3DZF4_9PEZI|nr:hypothetical protein LTS18_005066 [Coniosporium uncinatum]
MSNMLFTLAGAVTLCLCILPYLLLFRRSSPKPEPSPLQHFRFLELPRELRDEVYSHLVTNPSYPAIRPPPKPRNLFTLIHDLFRHTNLVAPLPPSRWHGGAGLLFTCSSLSAEYTSALTKHATFALRIQESNKNTSPLWPLRCSTLSNIRYASIHILATPSLLGSHIGSFDPRRAPPSLSWPVLDRAMLAIEKMDRLRSLEVVVRALGNPLWNPLWLWWFAGMSFKLGAARAAAAGFHKLQETAHGKHELVERKGGVRALKRIKFELEGWTPGENWMARNFTNHEGVGKEKALEPPMPLDSSEEEEVEHGGDKGWTWRCSEGHRVGGDVEGEMPIRQFCAMLYRDCEVCRPRAPTGLEQGL